MTMTRPFKNEDIWCFEIVLTTITSFIIIVSRLEFLLLKISASSALARLLLLETMGYFLQWHPNVHLPSRFSSKIFGKFLAILT